VFICRTQATKTALDHVASWPQFNEDAYKQNPELHSKETFISLLGDFEQRLSNDSTTSANHWLEIVQFYLTTVRSLAGHVTVQLQVRAQPGYWSKIHAVDCILWSLVSLMPVRAIGAIYFFRATRLTAAQRTAYISYRRTAQHALLCSERFNAEVGRQRALSLSDNDEFWQSLHSLMDIVDRNSIPSSDDRCVNFVVVPLVRLCNASAGVCLSVCLSCWCSKCF